MPANETRLFDFANGAPALVTDLIPISRPQTFPIPNSQLELTVADLRSGLSTITNAGVLIQPLAAGDNVIYAPLPGFKRSFNTSVHNPTAGSITVYSQVSFDGGVTWFRSGADQIVAANAVATVTNSFNPWPELGATYGIHTTALGLLATGYAAINAANIFNTTKFLSTFIAGANILYTVPAGMVAIANNLNLALSNETGGAISIAYHLVPPGQSPTLANRVGFNAAVANNAVFTVIMFMCLTAGYTIQIVSSSNGKQMAGLSFFEVAA